MSTPTPSREPRVERSTPADPSGSPSARSRVASTGVLVAVAAFTAVVAVVVVRSVDPATLGQAWSSIVSRPVAVVVVAAVYATAFLLRAVVWSRVVPRLGVAQALAAIHLALAGNHVLPLRLGEPLRVLSVSRRTDVDPATAGATTVLLRGLDLVALVGLALVGSGGLLWRVARAGTVAAVLVAVGVTVTGGWWVHRRRRSDAHVRGPGPVELAAIVVAWACEAVVIHQAAAWAGVDLSFAGALTVTVVAVAAQVAAVAPGGFGTYEAAGTATLVALGVAPGRALAIVLVAHGVKTVYALLAGAVALVVPSPGALGRWRLPTELPARPAAVAASGPVVLFLPAHDEEATVARVVARCPDEVQGHRVVCMVVDDGSTDRTAERAAAAGAEVVRLPHNRGLGAAVREGLAIARARDAVAVAFCDADGEYDPVELGDLVAPVLAGEVDYLVGSRFDGHIARMLPHRRLGNRVLTAWTAWTTRLPISDGQSGYRVLSPAAADAAVVAHDFNYAQVLTLDLVARGFRYGERPIRYRFREEGRSFVRLGAYLRHVLPTVHRVVNQHS